MNLYPNRRKSFSAYFLRILHPHIVVMGLSLIMRLQEGPPTVMHLGTRVERLWALVYVRCNAGAHWGWGASGPQPTSEHQLGQGCADVRGTHIYERISQSFYEGLP